MQDQAHIRPVHPHPESHSGHQHRCRMLLEVRQGQGATLGIHTGVIGDGLDAHLPQPARPGLHRTARAGIDQHRPAGLRQRLQHLRQRISRTPAHHIGQVVAPGGAHLNQGAAQLQQPDQISPHPRRCRGAQGHQRHPRAETTQLAEASVVGPEVVPPGTDAVGLIDGHPHQLPLILDLLQQLAGGLHLQALRRQIEQPQPVGAHPGQQIAAALGIQPPMQAGGGDAATLQVQHLVLHQGHQR